MAATTEAHDPSLLTPPSTPKMGSPRLGNNVAHTFIWPYSAGGVGLAGSFDGPNQHWNPIPMNRRENADGFELTMPLVPERKYTFKFVVDGNWVLDQAYPVTYDGSGNANHEITVEKVVEHSKDEFVDHDVVEDVLQKDDQHVVSDPAEEIVDLVEETPVAAVAEEEGEDKEEKEQDHEEEVVEEKVVELVEETPLHAATEEIEELDEEEKHVDFAEELSVPAPTEELVKEKEEIDSVEEFSVPAVAEELVEQKEGIDFVEEFSVPAVAEELVEQKEEIDFDEEFSVPAVAEELIEQKEEIDSVEEFSVPAVVEELEEEEEIDSVEEFSVPAVAEELAKEEEHVDLVEEPSFLAVTQELEEEEVDSVEELSVPAVAVELAKEEEHIDLVEEPSFPEVVEELAKEEEHVDLLKVPSFLAVTEELEEEKIDSVEELSVPAVAEDLAKEEEKIDVNDEEWPTTVEWSSADEVKEWPVSTVGWSSSSSSSSSVSEKDTEGWTVAPSTDEWPKSDWLASEEWPVSAVAKEVVEQEEVVDLAEEPAFPAVADEIVVASVEEIPFTNPVMTPSDEIELLKQEIDDEIENIEDNHHLDAIYEQPEDELAPESEVPLFFGEQTAHIAEAEVIIPQLEAFSAQEENEDILVKAPIIEPVVESFVVEEAVPETPVVEEAVPETPVVEEAVVEKTIIFSPTFDDDSTVEAVAVEEIVLKPKSKVTRTKKGAKSSPVVYAAAVPSTTIANLNPVDIIMSLTEMVWISILATIAVVLFELGIIKKH